jgi:class 3 adenylate cyclase
MWFAKRRWRRLMDILRPYQGRDALAHSAKSDPFTPSREKLGEVELICVVAHLRNFESIMAQLSLRDFGGVMIEFDRSVADAIMAADGDVNEFCGPSVVGHFNVLHRVEEARIIECAMAIFRDASASFDPQLGAQIGVGICRGLAIAGNFGSTNRFAYTAMGSSAICAHHLAEKAGALSICEEFAGHFSRPQIPSEPWIAVERHWKIDGKIEGKIEA